MNKDLGRGYHWMSSSPSDIKISITDYFRMVDVIKEERLSPEGLMKFKNLYEMSMMGIGTNIFLSVIPSLAFSYLFSTNVRKSHSGYK